MPFSNTRMIRSVGPVILGLALLAGSGHGPLGPRSAQADDNAPPASPPARPQNDSPGDPPSPPPPPPPRGDRPQGARPRAAPEDAIRNLGLTPDQQQKANALLSELHQKERQAREDFLHQLQAVLTPEQFQKLKSAPGFGPPPTTQPTSGAGGGGAGGAVPSLGSTKATPGTVIFQDGYETDPRDGGRPVVLIAAALNVSSDVFRQAFTGVTPAAGGNEPEEGQVRQNKQALMNALGPLGVTNDRLDAVSNFYRYSGSRGQMWRHTPATATAIISHGTITGFTITNPGAGYSSPPNITVAGFNNVKATATLTFGTDFKTNGSIKSITLEKPPAK